VAGRCARCCPCSAGSQAHSTMLSAMYFSDPGMDLLLTAHTPTYGVAAVAGLVSGRGHLDRNAETAELATLKKD